MNWLKSAVIDANGAQFTILDVLKKNVGGYGKPRSRDYVHASDATKPGFCPREWALMDTYKVVQKEEYIGTALQATFDVGLMTEDLMVNRWLGNHAVGNWKCDRCGETKTLTHKPGNGCMKSQECRWQYVQAVFKSTEYGVGGAIDVLVNLGAVKLFVTEIKIMKVEDFAELMVPLPEHRIRTCMYLKLIADSTNPLKDAINLQEARVVYISRGFGKKNLTTQTILPFKEYVIKRDDKVCLPTLERAKQVKVFRDTGKMPQGICNTALDTRAKNCQVCTQCFSGNHPVTQGVENGTA